MAIDWKETPGDSELEMLSKLEGHLLVESEIHPSSSRVSVPCRPQKLT